jgi:energy-coupling factor transporter ATP-binding protein EcfA2
MRLKRYSYSEWVGSPDEWILEPVDLQQLNLIVGKNSTGKSRTLNTISALSKMLSGGSVLKGGDFVATFIHEDKELHYEVLTKDQEITKELLVFGDDVLLDRGDGGAGTIFAVEEGKSIKFQCQPSQVAAFARYDTIQHPFLDPLVTWAKQTYHFHFGGITLGKNNIVIPVSGADVEVNIKDEGQTTAIFRDGLRRFGAKFEENIVRSMNEIGYDITVVDTGPSKHVKISGLGDATVEILRVHEVGIGAPIEQHTMSDGMFAALALIIHLNHGLLSQSPECILLDDIGQGLDFERSKALIELVIAELGKSQTQIIMTSNDRFIMNAIDLKYWSVLVRDATKVRALNRFNAPKPFEEFRFTGLSNFDFFSHSYVTRH